MTLLQVMADTGADQVRLRTDDARLIGDELATRGMAASLLRALGFHAVADLLGGYDAWQESGAA